MQTKPHNNWLQVLWWLGLYLFWILVFQKREFAFSRTVTIEFCYLVFIAANVYLNIYFVIPRYLYRKKYIEFVCILIAGILFTAVLRVPLAMALNQSLFLVDKPQPPASALFVNSLLNIFIWVVCILAGKLIIDRFHFQQYVDNMEKEKERAELDFLNAQFNPHFLFNSINSIYGHIDKHNITARNMLLTFSDMLRYQLYDCNSNCIKIEKEMNYIKNYVVLQQTRKEDSLVVKLNICEGLKSITIAPLLFIAFIENAFKYVGSSEEHENVVDISFHKENNALLFKCYNTKESNHVTNMEHQGIGIDNVKRRLALLYPGKYSLAINSTGNFYEVNLKLQMV